jgi:hypothetical protein
MTREEFIAKSSLKLGTIILTNRGSIRELVEFVENSSGSGMRFRGIDPKSKSYNSINKYIYLSEINLLLDSLRKRKTLTFNEVSHFVSAHKKGGCVTLITVEIVVNFLKLANANYDRKILSLI